MGSLKAFMDDFADDLGTTPALIYERQRALVRARILVPEKKGKGPGHGVIAAPSTVARVLIAVLASIDLLSCVRRCNEIGNLTRSGKAFLEALTEYLATPDKAARLVSMTVSKSSRWAALAYKKEGTVIFREAFGDKRELSKTPVRILVEIDGTLIFRMAKRLSEEIKLKPEGGSA
jgi:hypothetical protein